MFVKIFSPAVKVEAAEGVGQSASHWSSSSFWRSHRGIRWG